MNKAAQGFTPETYDKYVENGKPRRTLPIGKIAIYGWKRVDKTHMITMITQGNGINTFSLDR